MDERQTDQIAWDVSNQSYVPQRIIRDMKLITQTTKISYHNYNDSFHSMLTK